MSMAGKIDVKNTLNKMHMRINRVIYVVLQPRLTMSRFVGLTSSSSLFATSVILYMVIVSSLIGNLSAPSFFNEEEVII